MVKLIESSQFADVPEIGAHLADFNSPAMSKEAENIFGRSYDSLRPTDDKYVGIHLTALGDEETFGPNRNFDSFPKEACVRYHDTFVKHGHVFWRHHNDAEKDEILGTIKASAYNDKMGRIELFIWADKEKAKDGLDTLEKTGECSFSMACRVPWDECSVCGAHRKNNADPNMCDHIRYGLGKVAEDGQVAYMRNVMPDFFDISFVPRPADRIAYSLCSFKAASGEIVTSELLAKAAGVIAPAWLDAGLAADKRQTLHLLADKYDGYARKSADAQVFGPVAKVAETLVDDETIDTLRKMPIKEAMAFLIDRGVFLGPDAFCRYAMGAKSAEYAEVGPHAAKIGHIAAQAIKDAAWLGRFDFVGASDFDVDCFTSRPSRRFADVAAADACVKQASFTDTDNINALIVGSGDLKKVASEHIDETQTFCFNTLDKPILATALKYAEYKVSTLTAALNGGAQDGKLNTNTREALLALVAAQDL